MRLLHKLLYIALSPKIVLCLGNTLPATRLSFHVNCNLEICIVFTSKGSAFINCTFKHSNRRFWQNSRLGVIVRWPWAAFQPVSRWEIEQCIRWYHCLTSKKGEQLYILRFAKDLSEQYRRISRTRSKPAENECGILHCFLAFAKVTVWDSSQGLWSQPMLLRSSVHGRLPGVL